MFTPKSRAAQGAGFGAGFGGFSTSSTTLSYLTPPPDFSAIPHEVVVPFKNLLKKASTTKEKALQDILAHVQGLGPEGQLGESVVDTYVRWHHRRSKNLNAVLTICRLSFTPGYPSTTRLAFESSPTSSSSTSSSQPKSA